MIDHSFAKSIFEEIQARPYNVSVVMGQPSNNCYFKGIELIQRLGALGYAVRGRVGETYWDEALFPQDVLVKLPPEIENTHFYPEVMVDGEWRIVDPSFQPSLAKHGFYIGSWEGTPRSCFPITKLYSHEENVMYQQKFFNPQYLGDFFIKGALFWRALNEYFTSLEGSVG